MIYTVRQDGRVYHSRDAAALLMVGAPDWYAWLEEATAFLFQSEMGAFTARKEQAANGRGGWYWKAYRKHKGKLYRAYLGKSECLDMAVLSAAARKLTVRTGQQLAEAVVPLPSLDAQMVRQTDEGVRAGQNVRALLVHTRWRIPPFREGFVSRPRLVERLNAAGMVRLLLLSAPAGFGKTTLLSEWARSCSSSIAWVALGADDNDLSRFWSYIVASLDHALAGHSEQPAIRRLVATRFPSSQALLIELINVLDALPVEIFFVFDDYHLIEKQDIHESLLFFLDHLPPLVHLLIATRYELPFSVGRLRAQGGLRELCSADLRFTPSEAQCFLTRTKRLSLSGGDIARLVERTEGWIAGLQLAVLSWQDGQAPPPLTERFLGKQPALLSYLLEEVLAKQPASIQRFLLYTAILERFTVDLCNVVTDEKHSERMLAQLARKNLFLCALDDEGQWYRYHHLLTEVLRGHMQRTRPALFRLLSQRASRWCERQGLLTEAMQYALDAEDFFFAADLLERMAPDLVNTGNFTTLLDWLNTLEPHIQYARPQLYPAWIEILAMNGCLDEAEQRLQALERAIEEDKVAYPASFRGVIAALYTTLASVRGDSQNVQIHAQRALALLPEEDAKRRGSVYSNLGNASFHRGDFRDAQQAFTQVIAYSQEQGEIHQLMVLLRQIGASQVYQGMLHQAKATYEHAIQLANRYHVLLAPFMAHIYAVEGTLLYEWNELEAACARLLMAIDLARKGNNLLIVLGGILTLTATRLAQGMKDEAISLLEQAEETAQQINGAAFREMLAVQRVDLFLSLGDVEAATRVALTSQISTYSSATAAALPEISYFSIFDYLVAARLCIAQGDSIAACRLLDRLQGMVDARQSARWSIQILTLQALALEGLGDAEGTVKALGRALELAEPGQHIRLFVDLGPAMVPLLARMLNVRTRASYSQGYIKRLLAVFRKDLAGDIAPVLNHEALSIRELSVLRSLATGLSDREIAQQLVLSEHTIKTHTRHIYSKLAVHSRTQAIARAKELNLL